MTIEQLRAKRAEAAKEIERLRNAIHEGEGRDFTAEEREAWDRANGDFDRYQSRIEIQERADDVKAQQDNRTEPPHPRIGREDSEGDSEGRAFDRDTATGSRDQIEEERALALQGWLLRETGRDIRDDHRSAMDRHLGRHDDRRGRHSYGVDGRELVVPLCRDYARIRREFRAQSALLGSGGGYTIPSGFVPRIESTLLQFGGIRQLAEIIRTESGNDLPMPTSDETTVLGEWITENSPASEQDVTFGIRTLKAYKASSKVIRVPRELLQDSAIDLAGWIADKLGERIGRLEAAAYAVGDGIGKPKGIATSAPVKVTAAGSTTFLGDELIDLAHSVDPAYLDPSMGVAWLMNQSSLKIARKLKSGAGEYLWGSGLNGGEANMLLGWPVRLIQEMASPASGVKSIVFGAIMKYLVRDVRELRMQRLVERYATSDQDAFIAWHRTDGFLLDAGTNPVVALDHT